MQISLENLMFFGFHGLYEEEKKLGNNFKVDVHIHVNSTSSPIVQINQTIDYVGVYNIVKKWMNIPTPLLETLLENMANNIFQEYTIAEKLSIKITKQTLPITNFEGSASVTIEKSRN